MAPGCSNTSRKKEQLTQLSQCGDHILQIYKQRNVKLASSVQGLISITALQGFNITIKSADFTKFNFRGTVGCNGPGLWRKCQGELQTWYLTLKLVELFPPHSHPGAIKLAALLSTLVIIYYPDSLDLILFFKGMSQFNLPVLWLKVIMNNVLVNISSRLNRIKILCNSKTIL